MRQPETKQQKLPPNVRFLIGLASLPSIALGALLIASLWQQGSDNISAMEVVYALVGAIGLFIAITGKRLF